MASSNLNIRIDDNLRIEATQVLADYGLSPTQAIKLFFNQVVATRKVPLSFDYQAYQPNAKTIAAMRELDNGGGTVYDNLDEFLAEYRDAKNQDQ
ncbi:type II toxin-antitoxin system RelB/DinJ family antitoxin [Moraxella sp. ZJ142]|uniref:type II toxin-antitoxin system RelB/DinJ family antitoxin n=1 Tax=Moraxella marmotae TaxID=3344520 RepID=UPI0035D51883